MGILCVVLYYIVTCRYAHLIFTLGQHSTCHVQHDMYNVPQVACMLQQNFVWVACHVCKWYWNQECHLNDIYVPSIIKCHHCTYCRGVARWGGRGWLTQMANSITETQILKRFRGAFPPNSSRLRVRVPPWGRAHFKNSPLVELLLATPLTYSTVICRDCCFVEMN